jgi:oligosaccharide repeat unit polymerase
VFFKARAKSLLLLLPAAAVFLLLNYFSFFMRAGNISRSLYRAINDKLPNYLLGQIPAFNHWFSTTSTVRPQTFGLKTFHALTQSLGLSKRVAGIYTLKFKTVHLDTNVYTAFRPLIEDFSAIGAVLILVVAGLLSSLCFERIRSGRARCLDLVFICAIYFYIFYAFITSPFEYVSYSVALLLFYGYLLMMRKHVLFSKK